MYGSKQVDRHNAVGMEKGWTAGVRFPAGARNLSHLYCIQTGSRIHPALYPMRTVVWRPRRERDNSRTFSAEIKNAGAIPSFPPHFFWGVVPN
jgi:hypothetical protein